MPEREKTRPLQSFGWVLAGLLIVSTALAIDTADELQSTREALRTLEQQQLQRLRELEHLEEDIARSAQRSLALRARERELNHRVAEQDHAIAFLTQAVRRQEAVLAEGRAVLRQLLRAQWMRDRHPLTDPATAPAQEELANAAAPELPMAAELRAEHRRVFAQHINRERVMALERQQHDLALLQQARTALSVAQAELSAAQAEISAVLGEVAAQEAAHLALVERAQRRARADALELERLERNAATLEAVLRRMATSVDTEATAPPPSAVSLPATDRVVAPATSVRAQGFPDARGRLAWPVPGPILSRYGSVRGSGVTSTWRGEVFAVAEGTPVRVVHDGRVVFANWMRGYGFLVIVDHGLGYLTLYGNVRDILVAAEQQVLQGEVIAHAGGASAVIAPGLYFELRHEGQTLNPAAWWDSK